MIICLHTVVWYQVFLFNTNNLQTVLWFQVFSSNTNNLHTVIWSQGLLFKTDNLYKMKWFKLFLFNNIHSFVYHCMISFCCMVARTTWLPLSRRNKRRCICIPLYGFKYSHLIQIIFTQLYGLKDYCLKLIIYTKWNSFAYHCMISICCMVARTTWLPLSQRNKRCRVS